MLVLDLDTKRRWRVSAGSGESPMWSRTGDHIVYYSTEGIMAAAVTTEPDFSSEVPRLLVPHLGWLSTRMVSPDGKRYRMPDQDAGSGTGVRINVVLNWFEELKRLVPTGR